MAKEREYQELYDRLIHEVSTLHQTNRRRIRNGMRMLVAVTLGLMLLMFLAEGNKVFTLMLWILSMFTVAAYLIAVEYADYELQKKIEDITQREQESFGALLELPKAPRAVQLYRELREGREQPAAAAAEMAVAEEKAPAETAAEEMAPAEIAATECAVETLPPRADGQTEAAHDGEKSGSDRLLERLLDDPAKLAGDLDALSRALQGLSHDLRRGETDGGKEDAQ